ncbi:hypothetical protein SETIT_7G226800v2 [Setaria italica]|uniref:Uncharacterized protein n=1 Tax=Setaria italica TaxID=4555 RepID=A0A368RYN5_SETIT|nr:hypothetical protein SETIT_7G226800v2 [Setaria italica]
MPQKNLWISELNAVRESQPACGHGTVQCTTNRQRLRSNLAKELAAPNSEILRLPRQWQYLVVHHCTICTNTGSPTNQYSTAPVPLLTTPGDHHSLNPSVPAPDLPVPKQSANAADE